VVGYEENVIFGTSNGTLYSLDPGDGGLNWKRTIGASIYSTPTIDTEIQVVYVGDDSGRITSIDLENGSVNWVWRSDSGDKIQSSPMVDENGNIVFGSDDSYLYSLYPNGTLAWRFEGCSGWVYTSPSTLDDMIFFGSCDGNMRAVSSDVGIEIWNFSTQFIPSSPAIFDDRVYFGSYESEMFCLDAHTGEKIWNTTMGGDVHSSPSVSEELVVVGCNDGLLYSLDRENGNIIWTLDLGPGDLETSPVISRDMVVVTNDQGLVIVEMSNGSVHRRFNYGNSGQISPSVFQNRVFFGDEQGYVYCLENKLAAPDDDDDDDHLDLNEELSVRRDVIYFLIAFVLIIMVIGFLYMKKYKPLREEA
jgi:outer membrane protein assembly factor BamB